MFNHVTIAVQTRVYHHVPPQMVAVRPGHRGRNGGGNVLSCHIA
jgi:hypothetical protein